MGSTFVTLGRDADGKRTADVKEEVGFWMHDSMLELWLRLLVLHLDEPEQADSLAAVTRNQWLVASRYGCVGAVPHGLEEATATDEGLALVKAAVASLDRILQRTTDPLSAQMLNLLGFAGEWDRAVDTADLSDVAAAFVDLLDFNVQSTASTKRPYPGSRQKLPLH
ncbi:MAG: hypothetical protein JWL86_2466 [Rhizobium sp.]|nr:hypothetical protein [Rhizobium sp.]